MYQFIYNTSPMEQIGLVLICVIGLVMFGLLVYAIVQLIKCFKR